MSAGQPSGKLGFLLPIETGKQGPYSSRDYFPKERLRDLWERQRYILTVCWGQEEYLELLEQRTESSNVYKATWGEGKDNTLSNVVCSQPGRVTNGQLQQATTGTANSRSIQLRSNDARDDEIEENLTQVGSVLGHWKNKALDMGNGVEATDPQIDWITEKAGINKDHIDFASARAMKFIDS
uniref:synaptosomal-associated protein 23-like n=1 Tax=Nyctereutes procyonoides TaxID=34880 RepID=UPI002443A906|nr:synaptosomal-associated protein 23-like [Nyctereutes procyonoides]